MEPLSEVRALIEMTEDDNSEFTRAMIEDILHNLGARIDTRYNVNVTHLIWQDGQNEKILTKCVNSSSIHVVSPLWVVECQQANEKVEENAWPADVDQDKLQVKKDNPAKVTAAQNASDKKASKPSTTENTGGSDGDSDGDQASKKKRKASKPKTKTPTKKTIVLSDEEACEPDEKVEKAPKTPKSKPLGAKRRPSSVSSKTAGKCSDKKKSKREQLESDTEENEENQAPTSSDATPKSKQEKASKDGSTATVQKKSPSSAQKKKVHSISLSQVSDFVRDAAYDMAKHHPEYVIFDSSDAQYVVVEKSVRTVKVFYALAKGSWIISSQWVLASVTAGEWLNPEPFEFTDLPSKRSRLARSDPKFKGLFHGERVFVRKGVEPGQAILQELFLICGAQIVPDEESASSVIAAPGESGGVSPKWLLDSLIVFEKLDAEGYLTSSASPTV